MAKLQRQIDELERVVKFVGLSGAIEIKPSGNQINLFVVADPPDKYGMTIPIAGYQFSDCLTFLRGYYFATTNQRLRLDDVPEGE